VRVVEIVFTRNEADLLQQNVDFHHKRGVDFFIITESQSTDNTREVMDRFEKAGIAKCFYDSERIMAQPENMNRMAEVAIDQYKADWIIASDTDEFWSAGLGLKKFLATIPPDVNVLRINRYQYFPTTRDTNSAVRIYEKMHYRENGGGIGFDTGLGEAPNFPARNKIIFRPPQNKFEIMPGNHSIHFDGRVISEVPSTKMMVREFPFRSFEQFSEKVIRAKDVFAKNNLYRTNKIYGTHWRYFVNISINSNLEKFYYNNIYFDEGRLRQFLTDGLLVEDSSLKNFG